MFTPEELLNWSDCLYQTLLSLYPSRFRRHFGAEMTQVFHDCCGTETERGRLLAFWLGTIKDVTLSVPLEWRREMERPDREMDYTGLMDFFMVAIVVGTNLIGWGSFGASIMLNWTFPGVTEYWHSASLFLIAVTTLVMAGLIGTIFALVVARAGRRELPHIKV